MASGESRYFRHPQNAIAVVLDCLPIAGISNADHHHTGDAQCPGAESFQRQQRVIDCSEFGAGHDEYRQLKLNHEVDHQIRIIDGNKNSAGSFDDPVCLKSFYSPDQFLDVNLCLIQLCSQMR